MRDALSASTVLCVEQLGEGARRHERADLLAVARLIEEVDIDLEGDRDARMSEDAADLRDVETEVEDEVAGERVALMRNSA
jgi:hypothetical protein